MAVKVQYPGVATAVAADLKNMGLLMRAAKVIAPGMDARAMAEEIRERLMEELDYEHEASTHRRFARTWRGHPFVVIPDVVTSLSRERVLVTEFVDGMGFEQVKQLPSRSATGSGRSCSGSSWARCIGPATSRPTPIRGTSS